tara:strand:+ start:643 stop:1074 length:432 start_codon:yes stop_codon:yes gene_type:complete
MIRNGPNNSSQYEIDQLKSELREMRRDIHEIAKAAARPNPVQPAQGMSENVLLQLLMSERDKSERQSDRLAQLQDPLAQLEQLAALNNMMPQGEPEGNKMLEEVIATVGGLIAAKMAQSETHEGGGAADHNDAPPSSEGDGGS